MTTQFNYNQFKATGVAFLETLVHELVSYGFAKQELISDHLCFRVQTQDEYHYFKHSLLPHGTLLTEANVNGRLISTFRLSSPFQTTIGNIPLLELPAPKTGTTYETGFEHAEFVLAESFPSIMARFPHLAFSVSGRKHLNPELHLKTRLGTAKFHPVPLDRVIQIEDAHITDIIFDFDGTLIQSREQIYEINRRVFSTICAREVDLNEAKTKFFPEFPKLFAAFEIENPLAKKQALELWGKVAQDFDYPLFDYVPSLLDGLVNLGFRLHLWTARDPESAIKIIQTHGLQKYFVSMSFACETTSKPASQSLKWDWQAAPKNSVLMIGDSPTDILGGKNINAITVAALWDPAASLDSLTRTGAELYFHSPADLHSWLS